MTSIVLQEDLKNICQRIGAPLNDLAGRKLLITGGAGFLVGYVVEALLHANHTRLDTPCQIICLDNFITGVPEKLSHWQGRSDITILNQSATEPVQLTDGVDYIIHGASIASPPTYRRYPLETIDVNVGGTRNMLELGRQHGVRSLLYISSSEVYGDPASECIPTPETYWGNVSFTGPRACYDESKRLAETLCMVYFRQFASPIKIIRPFNVYGPTLRLDDGRIIPDLLGCGLRGEQLTLFSDGKATRSFCYIADAVSALLLVLLSEQNGEAFNVGNDEEVSIAEVAYLVDELFGQTLGVRRQQSQDTNYVVDNPQRRCPDLQKICSMIPWQPQVLSREGLTRTISWYREKETK